MPGRQRNVSWPAPAPQEAPVDEWIGCDTRTADGLTCPARALVHVSQFDHNERKVHYCGHHADEYMDKLRAFGIIEDDRLAGKVVAKIEVPQAVAPV
jgi:hypothetical protein